MKSIRLGIFPNMSKNSVRDALPDFVAFTKSCGLNPVLPVEISAYYNCEGYDLYNEETLKQLDSVVSLGGDGTLLKMARYAAPLGIPAFGINFGKLGFLAEINLQNVKKAISKFASGNYALEQRSLLQAEVLQNGICQHKAHALNDFVLAKGMLSKLAHLQMFINGKPSGTYAADGIIIATATGSTAYSLSAGGPLVEPGLDVSVITPVCAHSLTARALVIPMSEIIELRALPGCEEMLLSADGENVAAVKEDMSIRISKSPYKMQFVRLTDRNYYETWQQKLMRNM